MGRSSTKLPMTLNENNCSRVFTENGAFNAFPCTQRNLEKQRCESIQGHCMTGDADAKRIIKVVSFL